MIDVIDIIRRLQIKREQDHIQPTNVPFVDINAEVIKETKEELNKAVREGTLEFHKTINSISFNLKQ